MLKKKEGDWLEATTDQAHVLPVVVPDIHFRFVGKRGVWNWSSTPTDLSVRWMEDTNAKYISLSLTTVGFIVI